MLERRGLRLVEPDRHAGPRRRLRDARAHEPGADDADPCHVCHGRHPSRHLRRRRPVAFAAACGGRSRSSTRSTRARSPTRRATASATSRACARAWSTCSGSASTRSGCRRSTARRWPTSATTWPTTATSIRSSATSRPSTRCSPTRTRATSACCWTGSPTTPPTSTRGSSRAARRATRPSATGTAGTTARRSVRPTTGRRPSAAAPRGRGTRPPSSGTCTPSCPSSPTSTGTTRRSSSAMHDVLRFWLDRGVDGFRADVVHLIGKDPALPDIPETDIVGSHLDVVGTHDYQGTHALLRGIRAVLDEYPGDRMMVGEVNLTRTRADRALPRRQRRAAPRLRLRVAHGAVGGRRLARAHRPRRGGHGRALADLGLLQPRPAAHAHAPGRLGGPRARRRAAAAHAARHALPLRRRGARPRGRARAARARRRSRAGATAAARRSRGPPTPGHGWPADPWLPWPPEPGARSVEAQRADAGSMLHLARADPRAAPRRRPPCTAARSRCSTTRPDGVLAYERATATTAAACGSTSARRAGGAAGGVGRGAGDGRHRRRPAARRGGGAARA